MNAPTPNRSFRLGPLALGGGELAGDKIVRMAFLDEAGMSNPKHEPFVAVAGVVVNADRHWQQIARDLEELWYDKMPDGVPDGYPFHATELFSGGKFFTREKYDRETRWKILDEIIALPAKYNLAVVASWIERAHAPNPETAYTDCFTGCATCIEAYMRMLPDRSEVAFLTLEDNHTVRSHVREAQASLQNPLELLGLHAHKRDERWLTRIMGEPHFEQKSAISLLQIADACAFAFKRYAMGRPDALRFVEPLLPQAVTPMHPTTVRDEPERFV